MPSISSNNPACKMASISAAESASTCTALLRTPAEGWLRACTATLQASPSLRSSAPRPWRYHRPWSPPPSAPELQCFHHPLNDGSEPAPPPARHHLRVDPPRPDHGESTARGSLRDSGQFHRWRYRIQAQ